MQEEGVVHIAEMLKRNSTLQHLSLQKVSPERAVSCSVQFCFPLCGMRFEKGENENESE